MKRLLSLVTASLVLAIGLSPASAAVRYFDVNDTGAESGVVDDTAYAWDTGTTAFWNPLADGSDTAVVWANGDDAVFAAGTDTVGIRYGVNIAAGTTAASALIEEGTLLVNTGILDTGTGVTEVSGSTTVLEIASTLRLNGGGTLKLSDGTLFQTNPGGAGSLISALKSLEINGTGTVRYELSTGCNCSIYTPTGTNTILGTGGTTTNGGAGTLIKTGAGEMRYQGVGLPNSTYAKLVVNDGLFRLGNSASVASELGFGAAPLAFLPDAITLDGGAIGTSFGTTLHVNRGITINAGNGWFNNVGGTMSVPSVISGVGSVNKDIDPTLIKGSATASGTVNFTSPTGNTYAGGTNINAGNLKIINTSGSGTGSGPVTVGGSSTTQFGTFLGHGSVSGLVTLNQFGELRPGGTTTATLDNAGTIALNGGLTLNAGSLISHQIGATGNDLTIVGGVNGLNIAGAMTLNILANGTVSAGTFPIIDYDTSFLGSISDIVLGTTPAGFTYGLVDNLANTTIDLSVVAPGVPGDYNDNGVVDAADYVVWRKGTGVLENEVADPGVFSAQDYTEWRTRFGNTAGAGSGSSLSAGAVPEPTSIGLVLIGLAAFGLGRRGRVA